MPSSGGFEFGPFRLDAGANRLLRAGSVVPLPAKHLALLHALVSRAGDVVTKDQLIRTAWRDTAATDNSLAQAVTKIRKSLAADDTERYITTEPGQGYRFVATVTRVDARVTDADLDALLEPHRAWIDGRAALETLELTEIARARSVFAHLLGRHPHEASVHVGFANACVLQFEATRANLAPDTDALRRASAHAREACRLNPEWGEAWATLGFVLERTGDRVDALAALRRGVQLEPDNWRHWLRLSYGSSGEERLRAARRTLALLPGCPLAHCLAATVYVARNALAEAEREVDAGLAAMSGESSTRSRFSAVALNWLKGLLCLARGADNDATYTQVLDALERELALEAGGHLYARECCANAWYAIGVCRLRRGDQPGARAALAQAIARVPLHLMAHAALALLAPRRHSQAPPATPMPVDIALARAASLVADGDPAGAARLVAEALASAPPGNAGWLVPIEPLLGVQGARAAWTTVLATLRTRAS